MKASLETVVRMRAEGRCEYCRLQEKFSLYRHEIDHIVARKHRGRSTLENLALACTQCNQFKGPNLSGLTARTRELTRLFNPRADEWGRHFRLANGKILGKTAVGKVTAQVLGMNLLGRVDLRRLLPVT